MSKIVFDKKQLPQIILLGTLSAGLFGFFGLRLLTPPPTQAAAPPIPVPGAATAAAPGAVAGVDPSAFIGAGAPTDGMRDPFIPGLTAAPPAPVQVASASMGSAPPIPGLPGAGDVRPLPAAPAYKEWTVTGVICSDLDRSAAVAIFRSGDERRYVRLGSLIDDSTRLIGIDRNGVTVARGEERTRLTLGGVVAAPRKAAVAVQPTGSFIPSVAPPSLPDAPAQPSAPVSSPSPTPAQAPAGASSLPAPRPA